MPFFVSVAQSGSWLLPAVREVREDRPDGLHLPVQLRLHMLPRQEATTAAASKIIRVPDNLRTYWESCVLAKVAIPTRHTLYLISTNLTYLY